MAEVARSGVLEGTRITLDGPVPPLDGRRVRVVIAPEDDDRELSSDDQSRIWREWVERGPQGPIEDDGEQDFP